MKRGVLLLALGAAVALRGRCCGVRRRGRPTGAAASSHREAPLIADDPAADNTDVYAFVSPDKPDTVTIIANYIPFEDPAGGPNYYRFDPTVRYELHVDNNGDAVDDVTYQFRFKTSVGEPEHVPLQHGPGHVADRSGPERQADVLGDADDVAAARRCSCSGAAVLAGEHRAALESELRHVAGRRRSRRRPEGLRRAARRPVLRRPRLDLRPRRPASVQRRAPHPARDRRRARTACKNYNTHTIAHPGAEDRSAAPRRRPTASSASTPVPAGRRSASCAATATSTSEGPWVQVSRLGNPLINEVVIPVGKKDYWNASSPRNDSQFLANYRSPELASLVNLLYPVLPDTPDRQPRRPRRGAADGRKASGRVGVHVHRRPEGGPAPAQHGRASDRVAAIRSACSRVTSRGSRTGAGSRTT